MDYYERQQYLADNGSMPVLMDEDMAYELERQRRIDNETKETVMNNIHPLFRAAIAPFSPRPISLRPFEVCITIGAETESVHVVAFTSCDAVCKAIDLFFDGEDSMPVDSLRVEAHPMNLLPVAA